ncbi:ependymin-like [Xyrichtys novacula]|uniref:Ependymin-like n=1 Tax=Xyrichtys novacula TaxID=13765 RepID=A0AAV1HKN5_XYRNO|nr:ependymin-like [Xyrichtys novacula]
MTQTEELFVYAKFLYDALGERIRVFEIVTLDNKTVTQDILLHYREQVMYEIHDHNRTCKKSPLKVDFVPLGVPGDATLLAQSVLGDSSRPGEGLLVNSWKGKIPTGERMMITVTAFGCVPISFSQQTKEYGWLLTSYFDNVIGITDPELLNPPSYCPKDGTMTDEKPADLLRLLFGKN